mmetsp:Transcript_75174/g.244436  ORF Transcript_75174/g.244436 Transcript_75174/m.244436 type:complete len:902 (-) Transcript_75174:27-2732(-)
MDFQGADAAAGGAPPRKAYGSCSPTSDLAAQDAEMHPLVLRLLSAKHVVLGAWLITALISFPFAPTTFDRLNFEATPLRGSALEEAARVIEHDFPGLVQTTPLVVMISCSPPCEDVVDETSFQALWEIAKLFQELNVSHPGLISSWDSPSSLMELRYSARLGLGGARSPRVSEDRQTLLSVSLWTLPASDQERLMPSIHRVRSLAAALGSPSDPKSLGGGRAISVQGDLPFKDSFKKQSEHEFLVKDSLMVPFTLGVFLYQVRSWRLALLVAAGMAICLAIALATLLLAVDRGVHLNMMTPAMMAATCVAMSVDYGLFILSRFQDERQSGAGVDVAISIALVEAGSVVALSGSILICCYLACLLFPGDMIFSLALGNLWILFLCVLASLTFTPCAISAFPEFFAKPSSEPRASSARGAVMASPGSRAWFKLGVWLTRWPFPIVVPLVLYAFMSPVAWSLCQFRTSSDIRASIPAGGLLEEYLELQRSFPGASASPIFLHFGAGGTDGVRSDRFFEEMCTAVRELVRSTNGTSWRLLPEDFGSVVLLPRSVGELLPGSCPTLVCLRWSESPPECPAAPSAQALLAAHAGGPSPSHAASKAYQQLWRGLVAADGSSSVAVVTPSVDLRGEEQQMVMQALWQVLPRRSVYSHDAVEMDMLKADYSRFPAIMALTLLCMFGLIGWAFKAALVPFKLFLTVVAPLFFVFGLILEAYELGTFDGFGIPHVNSDYGLHWTIPILAAPILTGLAVDYDVFLFARVYEFRQKGYDDRAAIVAGLAATGPIISGAGLVMALAFGSMLLSETRLTYEVGFALCAGVLMDTFIVRPLLVPSILMLGGGLNYWPQKMPEATISIAELEEHAEDVRLGMPIAAEGTTHLAPGALPSSSAAAATVAGGPAAMLLGP